MPARKKPETQLSDEDYARLVENPYWVHISGPMSGLPNCNRQMFDLIDTDIRQYLFIQDVYNPGRCNPNMCYHYAMQGNLNFICEHAERLIQILLPDWSKSVGSKAENQVAQLFDTLIFEAHVKWNNNKPPDIKYIPQNELAEKANLPFIV